jgi:hypothetical protein
MKKTIAAVVFLCLWATAARAADVGNRSQKTVDLGAATTEAMVIRVSGDRTQMAMWFPYEFWVEAAAQEAGGDRAKAEREVAYLKPYITILTQCSIDQDDGSSVYQPESQVRARACLVGPNLAETLPVPKPPALISATVAAMKAMMSSEGDAGSKNMHVLVFPNQDKNGKPLIDASKKGELRLVLKADKKYGRTEFLWKTPFDALSPAAFCSKCKGSLSAKWSYCPWCGAAIP